MNTRAHTGDVWVCTDCYFAHHYGYSEHDGKFYAGDSDTASELEPLARLGEFELTDNVCSNHYVGNVVDGNGDDVALPCIHCGSDDYETGEHDFSWQRCEGCGSSLGGSRYRLAIWEEVS